MNTSPRGTEPLDLVKKAVRLLYKANYHDGNGTTWKAIQLLETLIDEANVNGETEYKLYLLAKNYLRDSLSRWKYPTEKLSLDEEENMFDALGDIVIEVYKAAIDPNSNLKDYVQLRHWENADTSGLVTDLVKRLDKETYGNFLDVLVFRGQEEQHMTSFFKSMISFVFNDYQWYED